MQRSLLQFVALVLVQCFLLDPALAQVSPLTPGVSLSMPQELSVIEHQAITAPFAFFFRRNRLNEPAAISLVAQFRTYCASAVTRIRHSPKPRTSAPAEDPRARLHTAFDTQDEALFKQARRDFDERGEGQLTVFSLHPITTWGGSSVLTGAALKDQLESICQLIPATNPYNRLLLRKLLISIQFWSGTFGGPKNVGGFIIQKGQFMNSNGMNEESLRLTVLGPIHRFVPIYLFSGGNSGYQPAFQSHSSGIEVIIPLAHDIRGSRPPDWGADVIDVFSGIGGSRNRVERISLPDGRTAIRKTTRLDEEVVPSKLRDEISYIQRLRAEGLTTLPEIYSVSESEGTLSVVMEDFEPEGYFSVTNLSYLNSDLETLAISSLAIWDFGMHVYRSLLDPLYRQNVGETPSDFVERYHLRKIDERLAQARQKAPVLDEMIDAPVVRAPGMSGEEAYLPGWAALRPFLVAIAGTGLLSPPYLARDHGDLNFGDILMDPLEYARDGKFQTFRLIDPKYYPEGNDYLYDFAKLLHHFVSLYDLGRFDPVFEMRAMNRGQSGRVPHFRIEVDDEGSMVPFRLSMEMRQHFIRWLEGSPDFFGLEQGADWKIRLLFTVGLQMAGLPPFHLRHNGMESPARTFYLISLAFLYPLVDLILTGDYDQTVLRKIDPAIRSAWVQLKMQVEEARDADTLDDILSSKNPVPALREFLSKQRRAPMFMPAYLGRLARALSPEQVDVLSRCLFEIVTGQSPSDYAAALPAPGTRPANQSVSEEGLPRIATLTPNPVLVLTVDFNHFPGSGASRDTRPILLEPSGKALNMSVELHQWGVCPITVAPVGGAMGQIIRTLLEFQGVDTRGLVPIEGESRLYLILEASPGNHVEIFGAGPRVPSEVLQQMRETLWESLQPGDFLLLGGSLPKGAPDDYYATVIQEAKARGIKTYLDTRGAALRPAIEAAPHFIGVNLLEFSSYLGHPLTSLEENKEEILAALKRLVARGTDIVVISHESEGMIMATRDGAWIAHPPAVTLVSHTGAGDTIKVAFSYSERQGATILDALRLAAAASAISVTKPGTGLAGLEEAQQKLGEVTIEALEQGPPSKRVAIIGASAFLGKKIDATLRRRGMDVIGTAFTKRGDVQLDVTQAADVKAFLDKEQPDVVIYVAGETDPEKAEANRQRAHLLNAGALDHFSNFKGQFIYISSNYIFDGINPPYAAGDPPRPLNIYGETKWEGEQAAQRLFPGRCTIVRSDFLYGHNDASDKQTFIHQLVAAFQEGRPVETDNVQVRSPVLIDDVSRVVADAIEEERLGVIQVSGPDSLTKFQMAQIVRVVFDRLYPHAKASTISDGASVDLTHRPRDARMTTSWASTSFREALETLIPLIAGGIAGGPTTDALLEILDHRGDAPPGHAKLSRAA